MVAETPPLVTLNLRMPSNADRFDFKHFTVRSSAIEQQAVNFTFINLTEGSAHVIFPMRDLNLNETLTVTAVSMCLQEGEPSLPSSVSNKLILSERGEMQTITFMLYITLIVVSFLAATYTTVPPRVHQFYFSGK